MLRLEYTTQFKKDIKLCQKRNLNISELKRIIELLAMEEALPDKNKDHSLHGNYKYHRECHIAPDWLLIYRYEVKNTIIFVRTGTHSDLF